MTLAFRLSRRLARFKIGSVVAASLLTLACSADGPNGPGSDPTSTDPAGVSISPKSAIVGVNEAIQFQASTDTASASSVLLSASKGGKGRGKGRSAVVDVSVSPHSLTVAAGSTASFSATATLSDGSTTPAVTWSAGGGTIDASGMYTAGSVAGNYSVVARAANGVADSAAVVVSALAPQVVRISMSPTSASLPIGGKKHFLALGTSSAGDTVAIPLVYTATGGTISAAGDYTAGSIPGSYSVIAADSAKDLADTSTVIISAPTLTAVTLTPATVSLAPSGKQQFTATGTMSDGSTGSIAATFTATGGTVSSSGLYTAGATAGTYRVIGTVPEAGKADTSVVTIVTVASAVASVTVSPSSASLTSGQTSQLTASVRDSSGAALSGQTVSWTSSNTSVATVSSTGLVTGVGAGSSTITAASGGKQGQAAISVTSPPPPPTSTASGCPTTGYTRLVNVSTQSQLVAAINGALAGDQIRLAAGTYRGGFQTSRNGTSSDPITVCGPRTAIVDNGGGYIAHRADWWVYRGFAITNGLYGIRTEGASRNVFDSLLIEGIGQEAIELVQTSTYNTVTRSTIRETSAATDWAEGIYVGTSTGNDPSNNNRIIGNWFGPNLRAEHIQLNPGTSGTVVSDNHMDATGMPFKSGIISSIVGVFGSSNNTWTGNVITNVGNSSLSGFFVYESGSNNNVFHSNAVAGTFSYGFRMNGGSGNVVGCDNVESGTGTLANVACQ